MVLMGQARERIGSLRLLVELHELAKASDFAVFRSLIESSPGRQLVSVQGEEHLLLLFEQAREMDFSGATEGLEVHAALLESVGSDQYWTEVFVEHGRRVLAIEALRSTVVDTNTVQSGPVDWQDFLEKTWSGAVISLTDTAPDTLNPADIRLYMDEYLALERDLLKIYLNETPPNAPASPTPSLDR